MLKLIGAMSENRAIGKDNALLYQSRKDMQHFKEQTMGAIVVMGYNTYTSLPVFPLPNRMNYILDTGNRPREKGLSYLTKEEVLALAKDHIVWVIGGEQTYAIFMDEGMEIQLTIFKGEKEGDTFFPPFELFFEEVEAIKFEDDHCSGTFVTYQRI